MPLTEGQYRDEEHCRAKLGEKIGTRTAYILLHSRDVLSRQRMRPIPFGTRGCSAYVLGTRAKWSRSRTYSIGKIGSVCIISPGSPHVYQLMPYRGNC